MFSSDKTVSVESEQFARLKIPLQIAVFLALVLTTFAGEIRSLNVEIRLPNTVQYADATYMTFCTDNTYDIDVDALSSMNQRQDGDFKVFKNSFDLYSGHQRHAIIIHPNGKMRNQPDQVFLLSVPRIPKPMGWTNWQHPNYVETNAASHLGFNYIPLDRSTNAPPNSFELRYSIE